MKIIGHRGAKGLSPENTLASIEKAIEHGVDEIEIDIRMTSDGVAVLHHDATIVDPDGRKINIPRTPYAELLHHKHDLIALDHAIRDVRHRKRLIIELKDREAVEPVAAIIRDRLSRGWAIEEFAVASFEYKTLRDMRTALPDITLVVNEVWSGVRASSRARRLGTNRISMDQRWLWGGFLKSMRNKDLQISPYPYDKYGTFMQWESHLNHPERPKKWKNYIYGVITDLPDLYA